jgi:hypothetical protein
VKRIDIMPPLWSRQWKKTAGQRKERGIRAGGETWYGLVTDASALYLHCAHDHSSSTHSHPTAIEAFTNNLRRLYTTISSTQVEHGPHQYATSNSQPTHHHPTCPQQQEGA